MRRILVCTGVLGGGTALVFALAAATAMLFPQGTLVSTGWNGGVMLGKGVAMPAFAQEDVFIFEEGPLRTDVMTVPAMEAPAIDIEEAIP